MMNNNFILLSIFVLVDMFIMGGLHFFGVAPYLLLDSTRISFIILALYLLTNGMMVFLVFHPDSKYVRKLLNWAPSALVSLGLLGTVTGMFLIFNDLMTNIDLGNMESSIEHLLKQLSKGFSVSTITTITGISANILLNLKFVWFDKKVAVK